MSNKREATFHGTAGLPTAAELLAQGLPANYGNEPWRPQPEAETVGDWAGHTPAIDAEIAAGQEQRDLDADFAAYQRQNISDGIGDLVTISGENSRDHGFHDDWPTEVAGIEVSQRELGLAIIEKLALQHEEISESLGEIRSGRDPLEIYFVDKKGLIGEKDEEYPNQVYGTPDGSYWQATRWAADDVPLLKPEGFLVEQADAIIRIADLAYLVDGRDKLVEALAIKHEYNVFREHKHGRKF